MSQSDRLYLRISPDLKSQLETLATQDRRQLSDYVRILLEDHVKENGTMMTETKREHTVQELAASRSLWEEYIDPDNNAPFDEHTQQEREQMIREIWPDTPEE